MYVYVLLHPNTSTLHLLSFFVLCSLYPHFYWWLFGLIFCSLDFLCSAWSHWYQDERIRWGQFLLNNIDIYLLTEMNSWKVFFSRLWSMQSQQRATHFPIQLDIIQSISILLHDHCSYPLFLCIFSKGFFQPCSSHHVHVGFLWKAWWLLSKKWQWKQQILMICEPSALLVL